MVSDKKLTAAQIAGRKGGETTKRRHGADHYATIGRKGAAMANYWKARTRRRRMNTRKGGR